MVSVLTYLVFIHIHFFNSIHFFINLLSVFRVKYFTLLTSYLPVLIHLPLSAGIHVPYSAAEFSLATHRFDYSFSTLLLLHAVASTHLLFSEAASPVNSSPFFHSSVISCTSIWQHMLPRTPLAISFFSPPGSMYFISVSISTVNWDFSKLFFLSADVESKTRPLPIDKNPVFCTICSSKFNRVSRKVWLLRFQRQVAMQDVTKPAIVHQPIKLDTQNLVAFSVTWNCSQHGTGIAKIAIPPLSVFELSNRTSAAGKLCWVCNNPVYKNFVLSSPFFSYSRWAFIHPTAHLSCTAHSTIIEFNPVSRHALIDAKSSKEMCSKYSAALLFNTFPVRCRACNKGFYIKCSTGPKASNHDD